MKHLRKKTNKIDIVFTKTNRTCFPKKFNNFSELKYKYLCITFRIRFKIKNKNNPHNSFHVILPPNKDYHNPYFFIIIIIISPIFLSFPQTAYKGIISTVPFCQKK